MTLHFIQAFRWFALALTFGALLTPHDALAQKIVFQSGQENNNAEIFIMDADGSNQTNLTNDTGSDFGPHFSPDGTRIIFASNRIDSDEVYVMDTDGGKLTRLTNNVMIDRPVAWSPDGLSILFWSTRDSNEEIYTMAADANDLLRITDDSGIDVPYQFSPDGSRILYTSDRTGNRDIYTVKVDGSGLVNLTQDPGDDGAPHWSPDGSKIVFVSNRAGGFDIYSMNADDGLAVAQLATNPALSPEQYRQQTSPALNNGPRWSPDGTRILFRSNRGGFLETYTMNPDGSGLTHLMNQTGLAEELPLWSADGARILVLIGRDLYIMNPDGSEQTKLTNSPGKNLAYDTFGPFGFGPPMISAGGIVSANLAPLVTTISPLSIVSIFGTNFATQNIFFPTLTASGQLARILGEMCFEIGGQRVPIFAVTPTQANIQVSKTGALGPVGVVAIRNCDTAQEVRSAVEMVTLEEATPVFFLFPPRTDDGLIAARFNLDAVAVAPAGMFTDQFGVSRPATPGDIIVLYGTGWGETTAGLGPGELATSAAELLESANVMVTLGGVPLPPECILYVGVTPQTAGLYQLAIKVPANAPAGNNEVVLTAYGKSTPIGPVVPVMAP